MKKSFPFLFAACLLLIGARTADAATVEFLTPAALYAGHGGEVVQVDSTEKGVEFGQKLGISDSPQFEILNVSGIESSGDVNVRASLLVENDAIFEATLDVEGAINVGDKIITLGSVGTPTDTTSDGGGVVLLASTNKTILWLNAFNAWVLNQDVVVKDSLSVGALAAPGGGASLDLKATNKALLLNALTNTQRDALVPVARMVIYNTDTSDVEFFNGASWVSMLGGDMNGAPSSLINSIPSFSSTSGKNIQDPALMFAVGGKIGIGTATPTEKLDVNGNLKVSTVVDQTIYAQLSSSVDQVPGDTNPTVITYDTQDAINRLTHSTTADAGEIRVDTAGIYFMSPQPQVGKDTGAVKTDFDMFLQVNRGSGFVDEPNSNVKLVIKDSDITDVIVSAFTIQLGVGDKIRVMQRVSTAAVGLGLKSIAAEVGPPTVPRTPSIIFTMYRVGG